jgi:hypothetical protein
MSPGRNLVVRPDGQVVNVVRPRGLWFHSINSETLVLALYDHIEAMLAEDRRLPAPLRFTSRRPRGSHAPTACGFRAR